MSNLPEIENHRHSTITGAYLKNSPSNTQQQFHMSLNRKKVLDKSNKYFLESIANEEHQASQFRAQELQSTAENPFVRLQDNLHNIREKFGLQKREKLLEEKRRQQLRENSIELRELLWRINRAKFIDLQIKQNTKAESSKIPAYVTKRKQIVENIEYMKKVAELEKTERENTLKKQFDLRQSLLKQIEEKQNYKTEQYKLKLKEREHILNMKRYMNEEDRYERFEEKRKQKEENDSRKKFLLINSKIKKEQRELEKKNLFKDLFAEREEHLKKLKAEQREIRLRREALSNAMGEQLREAYEEKEKRQNLLQDLLVDERKANEDKRYRKRFEEEMEARNKLFKELQKLEKLKDINKKQAAIKHKELATQKHITMVDIMLQNDDDTLEQQKENNRRYRVDITQQIKDNKRHREGEIFLEKKTVRECIDLQKQFEKEVEMERRYLISEQPKSILEQLPAKDKELIMKDKYFSHNNQKFPIKKKKEKEKKEEKEEK